jgi:hypothetical protein
MRDRPSAASSAERARDRVHALVLAVEAPLRARQPLQHAGREARLGLLVHELERVPKQRLLASGVPGHIGGVGRLHQQVDLAHAGHLLRLRHALPEPQRAFAQRERLVERVHPLGRRRGSHRGGERGRLVARGQPVVGDLGGQVHALALALDRLLQGARDGAVQLGPLARQQVVVDHLAQQRVAEAVAAVGVRDRDLAAHGLAQPLAQLAGVEVGQVAQQVVVQRLAGEPAQDLLGGFGQPLHAQHQRVAQRRRQRPAAVEPHGQQLLREQRVALAARVEPLDQAGIRAAAEDVGQLLRHLVAAEALQLDQVRQRVARQLGQQRPQRVTAVELVGAVGADHQDPLRAQRPREEPHEAAGGAVRPVQVLDHEQQRLLLRHRVEDREQRLEHAHLLGLGARVARAASEAGQDRGEVGALARRQRVESGVAVARHATQRAHQRRVGQLALAQLDTVAAEHARARRARRAGQLAGQPRLANPGLARQESQRGGAGGAGLEHRAQLRQFSGSPYEAGARDPGRHAGSHPPRSRRGARTLA